MRVYCFYVGKLPSSVPYGTRRTVNPRGLPPLHLVIIPYSQSSSCVIGCRDDMWCNQENLLWESTWTDGQRDRISIPFIILNYKEDWSAEPDTVSSSQIQNLSEKEAKWLMCSLELGRETESLTIVFKFLNPSVPERGSSLGHSS